MTKSFEELEDMFNEILQGVVEDYCDWGFEAQMDEAKRLFGLLGYGEYDEL
jgi:hypothetical protein